MQLYFKIRDIENLDIAGQKEFIRKYIEDYCNFGQCGVEADEFIEHSAPEDPPLKTRSYIVAKYQVSEDADFDRIEFKIKVFSVHRYFVIFAIL